MTTSPAPTDDLASLSDDFTSPTTLSRWTRYEHAEGWPDQLESARLDVARGVLEWRPFQSVWYAPLRGPFMYQTLTGDFVMTVRVKVEGRATLFPTRLGSLAGLMIRAPRSGRAERWQREQDSYVVHATGVASGESGFRPAIEITSTVNGVSGLECYASEPDWLELRLVRFGAVIALLHRFEWSGWQLTQRDDAVRSGSHDYQGAGLLVRPDLPATLQAGLMAMADWASIYGHGGAGFGSEYFTRPESFNGTVVRGGTPDTVALFDRVHFARFRPPAAWARRNVVRDVPDAEWLAAIEASLDRA